MPGIGYQLIAIVVVKNSRQAVVAGKVLVEAGVGSFVVTGDRRVDLKIVVPAVVSTRQIRFGEEIQQCVDSGLADAVRRNNVVDSHVGNLLVATAIAGRGDDGIIDGNLLAAIGIDQPREVDRSVRVHYDLADRRDRIHIVIGLRVVRTLVGSEKESFVLDDRATERSAVVVLLVDGRRNGLAKAVGLGRGKVWPEEFIAGAM